MVHELVLEGSFERWLSIGYLYLHMLLCWLNFVRWFYIGHIPWIRNGLQVWSSSERLTSMISYMVWLGCYWSFLVGVLYKKSYLHNLYLEVCVEGHDTGYDLYGFSLVLVIFLDVRISLTLDLRLVRDCDHWFVLMYVMWEMTWLFLYLFPMLVMESSRDYRRFFMRAFSCRLLVYVLWMSLRLHGFTFLRCCEWIRFDIIFYSGNFLVYMWQVFLLRLMILGYRLDMLMMCASLGIPLEV